MVGGLALAFVGWSRCLRVTRALVPQREFQLAILDIGPEDYPVPDINEELKKSRSSRATGYGVRVWKLLPDILAEGLVLSATDKHPSSDVARKPSWKSPILRTNYKG